MGMLLQLLFDYMKPGHPRATTSGSSTDAYLKPFIILIIVLLCGPEVFLAADFVLLIELLGTALFLMAFAVGFKMLGLAFISRMRRLLFPGEWTALIKMREHPSLVIYGFLTTSMNALRITLFGFLPPVAMVIILSAAMKAA